ncbi:MAG: YbhB/YbcL family Raf kinase inhibitor-like protein, partial [Myxococcota bacterium]
MQPTPQPSGQPAYALKSAAFHDGGNIPRQYTCEGQDLSPPLEWSKPPAGTRSQVLIVDDPDAPDPAAPRTTWVHWVVYNIPPDVTEAQEGSAPRGGTVGLNDWKKHAYGGPCPPVGRHRYFFKLYALDTTLNLKNATKAVVEQAMKG